MAERRKRKSKASQATATTTRAAATPAAAERQTGESARPDTPVAIARGDAARRRGSGDSGGGGRGGDNPGRRGDDGGAAGRDDPRVDRERAANILKESPLFAKLSRRLLIDLAAGGRARVLSHSEGSLLREYVNEEDSDLGKSNGASSSEGAIVAIVVLKGTLIAAPKPSRQEERERPPYTSPVPPELENVAEFPQGVHLIRAGKLAGMPLGSLRLEPPRDRKVELLVIDVGSVARTPAVVWGSDLQALSSDRANQTVQRLLAFRRPELIWIAAPPGSKAPLEALTHVLAAKVARDYPGEPAALVTLGASLEALRWQNDRFEDANDKLPAAIQESHLYTLVGGPTRHGRVFVYHPADPLSRPARLGTVRFDRVVYLTDAIPDSLPNKVKHILRSELLSPKETESYFSSFIPSIPVSFSNPAPKTVKRPFKARHTRRRQKTTMQEVRPNRDSCTLRMDIDTLRATWALWQANGGPQQKDPFLAEAVAAGAIRAETAGRWARTVTNRRVGVACSGGGASAYRIGPLLQRIEDAGIPVDVFAGLSGGALIGAFYCHSGMKGFERARDLGTFFQVTMPGALVWTWPYEAVVDLLLAGARVENLETRFAAVAAELPEMDPPAATVVVQGSIGEAVRASGSLPPSFAPTDKNCVRYTDGGAGNAVPARIARDYGADVTIACNVIPGPARGNPFSILPGGWLIRRTPILGRLVDNYTWYAFFWSQMSREFGESAEVFVDFRPQIFPMLESSAFIAAHWIIDEAESEGPKLDGAVADLKKKWEQLG